MYQDRREARRASIKRAAIESAKRRTCPECGRGGALRRQINTELRDSVTTCRWCAYERHRQY